MRASTALTLTTAALMACACGRQNDAGPLSEAPAVPLVNASGKVIGEVRGGDSDKGATLLIDAHGLQPGVHGIHIHDVGLCEPPDFKSAGPHWNPTGRQHGGENPQGSHMGDLQNVTVGKDGRLRVEIVVPGTYLKTAGRNVKPGTLQILDANGASLVLHAKPDDYKTDPSGNSGARVACAVLGSPDEAAQPTPAPATAANTVAANSVVTNQAAGNTAR